MTAPQAIKAVLWILSLGAVAAGWQVWHPSTVDGVVGVQPTAAVQPAVLKVSRESLAVLVQTDPFRLGRRPATISYDPAVGDQPPVEPPAIQRPTLILAGLVQGGAVKAGALIEGLPGTVGARLLQVGDTSGGIRLRRIGAEEAVLTGQDTTWKLKLRRPWQ